MSLVQSKIVFNERKKRAASLKKISHGKENSDDCNIISSAKTPVKSSRRELEKRTIGLLKEKNNFNSKRKGSQWLTDSDNSDTENSASPPKRDRPSPEKTYSPSQHLNELNIKSPFARPDSNKTSPEKHLSPKRLFGRDLGYCHARQALHGTATSKLPTREDKLETLQTFLSDSLRRKSSASLYISGPPGTGKTACLTQILSQFEREFKRVYINCTTMKSSNCVFSRICEELGLKISGKTEKHFVSGMEKFLSSNSKMILLVLDEIDQLDSKRQAVLYTIFEWPSKYKSNLVLIGIANALDLTDRILPRLQSRIELKPKLMHFAPYTKQQIVHILTERLTELDVTDVFSPVALQLLAGKVAAISGDVRRALDIGRRVLELAETRRSDMPFPLQPTSHNVSNKSSPVKTSMAVDLKIVMEVLNSVYGTQNLTTADGDSSNDAFPLQQKVLLCSLILMMKKGSTKDVTVGKLHDVYRRVCVKRNLLAVDQAEFLNLCQLVEMRGAVRVETKKEARLAKVSLQWDEQEVAASLRDKQLLAAIVNDTSCLQR